MAKTKTLTLTAMFAALAVVGSFIKIPVPPGTAALDSTPAFISMAFLPAPFVAIAGAFGHIATALTSGFPLSLPIHVLIAVEMAVVAGVAAVIYRKGFRKMAWVWIIIANGVLSPLPYYFIISPAMYIAVAPGILIATLVNVVVSLLLLPILQKIIFRSGVGIQ
ncbi:MAG: ECF transporter S component [Kurthia sp.]|nr:ECF transporter S component [Candidatus Kurthia equi]